MSLERFVEAARELRAAADKLRAEVGHCPHHLSAQVINESLLLLLENQAALMEGFAAFGQLGARPANRLDDDLEIIEEEPEQNITQEEISELLKKTAARDQLNGNHSPVQEQKSEQKREQEKASKTEIPPREIKVKVTERCQCDQGSVDSVLKEQPEKLRSDPPAVPELHPEQEEQDSAEAQDLIDKVAEESPSVDASAEATESAASTELAVEVVPRAEALVAIRAFDVREESVERGLRLLNSWVSGPTGTPFQFRKQRNLAFLNVEKLSDTKIEQREQMMRQYIGHLVRLGRLSHEDLHGEVWLYRC